MVLTRSNCDINRLNQKQFYNRLIVKTPDAINVVKKVIGLNRNNKEEVVDLLKKLLIDQQELMKHILIERINNVNMVFMIIYKYRQYFMSDNWFMNNVCWKVKELKKDLYMDYHLLITGVPACDIYDNCACQHSNLYQFLFKHRKRFYNSSVKKNIKIVKNYILYDMNYISPKISGDRKQMYNIILIQFLIYGWNMGIKETRNKIYIDKVSDNVKMLAEQISQAIISDKWYLKSNYVKHFSPIF
jgi:hypothetical protein